MRNNPICASTAEEHAEKLAKDDAFGLCALGGHCVDPAQKPSDLGPDLGPDLGLAVIVACDEYARVPDLRAR
jgi:hypothetical protein